MKKKSETDITHSDKQRYEKKIEDSEANEMSLRASSFSKRT